MPLSHTPSTLETAATSAAIATIVMIVGIAINATVSLHPLAQIGVGVLIVAVLLVIAHTARKRTMKKVRALLMTPEAGALLGRMLADPKRELVRVEGRNPKILVPGKQDLDHESAGSAEAYLRWQRGLENLVSLQAVRCRKEDRRFFYSLTPDAPSLAAQHPVNDAVALPLGPRHRQRISLSELQKQRQQEHREDW